MVEFTLVLPLFLAALFGILWFGRYLNYEQDATHMANVAARYAAVNQVPPNAGTQTLGQWLRSQADTSEFGTGTGNVQGAPQVCVSYPNGTGIGNPVVVTMTSSFTWLKVLQLGPSSPIQGSATMRIEVPPTNSFFAATCS